MTIQEALHAIPFKFNKNFNKYVYIYKCYMCKAKATKV